MTDLGHGKGSVSTKAQKLVALALAGGIIRVDVDGNLSSSLDLDLDSLNLSNIELDNFKANIADTDGTLAANSDLRLATQKAIKTAIENAIAGDSYRKEVELHDSTQTDAAANIVGQVSYNADGVALTNGDRLLLTAETTTPATYNDRVFLVSGVGTAIVLTLEIDGQAGDGSPTKGDTLFVKNGTDNDSQRLNYNGTDWVLAANLTGALVQALNLSDLTDASAARTNIGLGSVNNTADTDKPISTATQTALDLKAVAAEVLKKDGSVALTAQLTESYSGVLDIVAASGITDVTKKNIKIRSSTAGACDITANPQIAAGVEGRTYRFIGQDDVKVVTFDNGDGLVLNNGQSFTLGAKSILVLYFDGADYIEESRSDN